MKKLSSLLFLVGIAVAVAALWSWQKFEKPARLGYVKPLNDPISMCGAIAGMAWNDSLLAQPKLLSGLGNLHYPVTTTSLEAQKFFEQGLRLVYAFNHWEAARAFREAARIDPECAMAYWGMALAYGPNINDVTPLDRERAAYEYMQQAKAKKPRISQVEKDLIDALAVRFTGKVYTVRDSLNQAYARAMQRVAQQFPDDVEVQTLYADAIMNTMPWDYWQKDGTPKPQTSEARVVLENVLTKWPNHPGAHHLYIHLVEASPKPEDALKSARFLETAMPSAGHLVHMPAHIYVRTGEYARSIEMNTKAVQVDENYLAASENQGFYRLILYPHNIDFISYSAYLDGRSNLAIQNALKMANRGTFVAPSAQGFGQYLVVEPMIAYTRFGKWKDILTLADPGSANMYPQVMWRFSRGMALARTNHPEEALFELDKLDSLAKLDTLKNLYISFNSVGTVAALAADLLRGEILVKNKKYDMAIAVLQQAVRREDDLRYNEPPDWKLPTRHYLGAALLEAGRYPEAEQVYLDDLKRNRENGWALTGLQLAQHAQGKKNEVLATAKRFGVAWKNSDVALTSSRF